MKKGEELQELIAENIRRERRRLCISQGQLAERADISLDTVKSIEYGRRAMSLDTYLRIVQALGTTPLALMSRVESGKYIDRFIYMMSKRDDREIEYILYMVEQLLRGQDSYLYKQ